MGALVFVAVDDVASCLDFCACFIFFCCGGSDEFRCCWFAGGGVEFVGGVGDRLGCWVAALGLNAGVNVR